MPPSSGPSDSHGEAIEPRKPKRPPPPPTPASRRKKGKRRTARRGPTQPAAAKPIPAKPVPAKPIPAKPAAAKPKPAKPAKPIPAKPAAATPQAAEPVAAMRTPKTPSSRPQAARGGAPIRDRLIGKTIARCKIEELIGLGRTARVYRATYEALDQVVALKILRAEVAEDPVLVERFETEAKAIAKVDNENVLKIYDVGEQDGLHYMVVELLEGEEILDLIQREERVEPMDAMRIVRQGANGLAAAHALGLVHRDIKPQNLFLLDDGTVKVVDFGLAANIDDGSERVGTPHYMAPEVCERGAAEPASDIYGLGIVLYHLLVGRPPHAGKDIQGILQAHIAGKPLRPERDAPGTPKNVAEVVRALTKHDPLMRPTASEVVDQLDAVGGKELKQKESLGRRRRRSSRARSAVARRDRAEARKGAPVMAMVLVGVLLVGGILAVVAATGGDDAPPPTPIETGATDETGRDGRDDGVPVAAPKREETAEEKAAREAVKAKADAEREAQEALGRAEQWAREHWVGPADTEAVLDKYRYVRNRYKETKAADEAKRRVRMIKQKKEHPHPDREWTSAEALAEAKLVWERTRPQVEKKIAQLDYDGAKALMPPPVSDTSGRLARELDYWHTYTDHLTGFRKAAVRAITNAGPDDRVIESPGGEGTIRRVTASGFEVRVGGRTLKYSWQQMGPAPIADLMLGLFSGEGENLILLLAFAYAHELDAFWDVQLELASAPDARNYTREMQIYEKKFRERAAK